MGVTIRRFDVFYVRLDPTVGTEMNKTRPCVVVSPDEINNHLRRVLIAPLTSQRRRSPFRIDCEVGRRSGQIAIDQMRVVDRARFGRKVAVLAEDEQGALLQGLAAMFAP